MVNPKRFYTYAYLRENKTPYYIGKGQRKRIYQSKGKPCSIPKDKNRIIFLKQNLTEEEAFKHEIYMISVFGRKCDNGILLNKSIGGQGSSGFSPSEETRKIWSQQRKGKNNIVFTQEIKDKISNSKIGKKYSLELRKKLSEAHKGKPHSEETKKKMGITHRGRTFTKEWREKLSEANKGKHIGKKWWNDGCGNTKFSVECPGDGWVLGRKLKKDT
jgi:hypothetical protein